MRILKSSGRVSPRVSIVLLDWSVRESFHLLHYLRQQEVPRASFEVLLVEYHSRVSPAVRAFESEIDTWILLDMPAECYYHKHLMYNTGIVHSRGGVCVFCDSDAMVRPGFVRAIAGAFERDSNIVLHLDQFRNVRRDLYPFYYPSFDEVIGPGCINRAGDRTKGIAAPEDPLHERNYGACMCAKREDLVAVGGADEHIDYLGHICGPYDMTFRLVNFGRREVWHPHEFLYHTWHPGQAGDQNYLGPHDGRHMSTTALEALATGRVRPYEENPAIRALREHGRAMRGDQLAPLLVSPDRLEQWTLKNHRPGDGNGAYADARVQLYRGFRIEKNGTGFTARVLVGDVLASPAAEAIHGATPDDVRRQIDRATSGLVRLVGAGGSAYVLMWRALSAARTMAGRAFCTAIAMPGRAVRGTIRFVGRSVDRVRRLFLERRFLSGALTSLVINLDYLGRIRRQSPGPRPIVMVDRRATFYYLKTVRALHLLAPFDMVRVVTADDVELWARALSRADWEGHVMVGRDLYIRHYTVLSPLRAMKRLVVT